MSLLAGLLLALAAGGASADPNYDCHRTYAGPQMYGLDGWKYRQVFTVGESVNGYTPPGVLDGLGAWKPNPHVVQVLANHEFTAGQGYAYALKNGTQLIGSRVSYFNFNAYKRCITGAGLAFDTIYDRCGKIVTDPSQLDYKALSRLCSAQLVKAGTYGFVDTIFFTGEEDSGGRGGTEWALDVRCKTLWACPQLGRAAWENVTPFDTCDKNTIGLIIGDDRGGAPLLMYIGYKKRGGNFLERNGLACGQLYAWVAKGATSPQDFNGKGSKRSGYFAPIPTRIPSMAGQDGYDSKGYLDLATLDKWYEKVGALRCSRPEDVSVNPYDGRQVVMASTGRGSLFPADNWGTIYLIDIRCKHSYGKYGKYAKCVPTATVKILYDGDDSGNEDYGIRSPDNLDWADNGVVYVQEDRSTSPSSLFGGKSGKEASIWCLDPKSCRVKRIAIMNRNATLPSGQYDSAPQSDIGNWESSGILDVTRLFPCYPGERLLIGDVQAHAVTGGAVSSKNLVQGGQLFFLSMHRNKPWWCKLFNGEIE